MKYIFYFFTLCLTVSASAQIGGRYAFDAIALPTNARATALGGSLITVIDSDVALAQLNPAVADSSMNNQLSFNHNFHFAGIQNGNVAFGKYLERLGMISHVAIQYINFGEFDGRDVLGNATSNFSGGDVAIVLGTAKQLNERIRAGINLKVLSGSYESYNHFGIGLDLGLHYDIPGSDASWGLVLKNIGGEISPLVDERKPLPLDLQIGFSKRLKHLPFRFSIIGHHLQEPYIRFDDPETDITTSIFGEQEFRSSFSKNIDNFFRHLIFSGEFLIGKNENVRLRVGYDHFRNQELKTTTFRSLTGFSFGIGFNIKKIKIDYGVGRYHLAGSVNHLSIRYDVGRIFKKI